MDSQLEIHPVHCKLISSLIFCVRFICSEGPDSRDSYATLKNVFKSVDLYQNRVKFNFLYNPLSYHYYAFKVHQGERSTKLGLFSIEKRFGPQESL